MMSEQQLSTKADLALSDLSTNGGLLNAEQNDTFIRNLLDQPTILNQMRRQIMNSPQMEISKIGFGKRILRKATQTPQSSRALGDAAIDGAFDASAEAAARAKPQTTKVTLTTTEVIAEVRIPYEVLEDNIERGGMENTILALIAERAALDLEEFVISGDTTLTGSDPYLGMANGILAASTAHIVDAAGEAISPVIFNRALNAMPTQYRRNRATMRFFSSMDVEQDYRLAISTRGTGLGDAILTGQQLVPVFGVPLTGAALMPNTSLIFANPKNFIFGVQRNIRVETERLISEREIKIVLTARIALGIEETDAIVKVINLG